MHRGKVDPGVSELPRGNELSRDHVNRPLVISNWQMGQCVHPKVFQSIGCKTAFCTELNLLTPFSFGKDNCLIVEIILHFAQMRIDSLSNQQGGNSSMVKW